jgi:WD40 repeat protein
MRLTRILLPLVAISCLAVPGSWAQQQAGSSDDSLRPSRPPTSLFDLVQSDSGQAALQLDRAALRQLTRTGTPALVRAPLPGHGSVDLEVQRFNIVNQQTVFARGRVGGQDELIAFDPNRMVLLRGQVSGYDGSSAYLAIGEHLSLGFIDLGPGRTRFALATTDPAAPTVLSVSTGGDITFPPLDVDVCGVQTPASQIAPPAGPSGQVQPGIRWLRMAIDTDYEYFQLFGDEDAAIEYAIALYGAISDIYLRDVKVYITLPFIRIWDNPDDLFNENDPLTPFRMYWEANMPQVVRDTAQLLTGRRNLPYGGVAYLGALCGSFGYSVAGYILGSFSDPSLPNFANWDITVCAHELGHTCGTGHTHDYGIDSCASGTNQRGTIMSYCHTTPGGNANIDPRFHTFVQRVIETFVSDSCSPLDCNLDGQADGATADKFDSNDNGILDECEDCNENGLLDQEEIAKGLAPDVNSNGIPDICEVDCNGNLSPDNHDIAIGTSLDVYGNGIPDECEADCNANGVSDYVEIQQNMSLDLDRNAVLDECQDCDSNGINDIVELNGALNIWASSDTVDELREVHATTGVLVRSSAAFSQVGVGGGATCVLFSPNGNILVSSTNDNAIAEYDRETGSFIRWFVASSSGGLFIPWGMTFGPDGNLYVASHGNHRVLKYDGTTGELIELFAGSIPDPSDTEIMAPENPADLAFGPNGNLFVTTGDGKVVEFDGQTGDFVRNFVPQGSGGLVEPRGLVFTDGGRLLVADAASNAILEYEGMTGTFVGRFDDGGVISGFWGLRQPWCLRIGPFGERLYVGVHDGSATIHSYDLTTGQFMRSYYVISAVIPNVSSFDFAPSSPIDCNGNLRPDACDIVDGISVDDCLPACVADVAGNDNVVDVVDLVALFSAWDMSTPQYDIAPPGGDGTVDTVDLLFLLSKWGPCQ